MGHNSPKNEDPTPIVYRVVILRYGIERRRDCFSYPFLLSNGQKIMHVANHSLASFCIIGTVKFISVYMKFG